MVSPLMQCLPAPPPRIPSVRGGRCNAMQAVFAGHTKESSESAARLFVLMFEVGSAGDADALQAVSMVAYHSADLTLLSCAADAWIRRGRLACCVHWSLSAVRITRTRESQLWQGAHRSPLLLRHGTMRSDGAVSRLRNRSSAFFVCWHAMPQLFYAAAARRTRTRRAEVC